MKEAEPYMYQIMIQGCLDPSWTDWFSGMDLDSFPDNSGTTITTLTGVIPDQPYLRGILGKIWDLNLSIISIQRIKSQG